MRSAVRCAGLLLGLAVVSACAANAPASNSTAGVSVAPAMTIERFLRATNQNDFDTMAQLFGTRDGSVTRVWTQKQVDERMLIFAHVLRHSDYTISGEQIVPGRRNEATQLNVSMTIGGNTLVVPFTLVMTGGRDWLIENIDIEVVTRGAPRRSDGQ